jgi:hypothetical protein
MIGAANMRHKEKSVKRQSAINLCCKRAETPELREFTLKSSCFSKRVALKGHYKIDAKSE